jgi:hypothetical protein
VNSTRNSPLLTPFLVLSALFLAGAVALGLAALKRAQDIEEGPSDSAAAKQPAMQVWAEISITLAIAGVACAVGGVAVNARGGEASAMAMPRPAPVMGPPLPPVPPPYPSPPQQPPGPQGPAQA